MGKINQYPECTTPADNDLLLIETEEGTKKVKKSTLLKAVVDLLGDEDISEIADGTVTGAITGLNNDLGAKSSASAVSGNTAFAKINNLNNDLGNTKLKTIEIANISIADGETKTINLSSYLPSGAKIKGVLSCKLGSYHLPYIYHGTSTIVVRTWIGNISDTAFNISCYGTTWGSYALTAVIAYG